MTTPDKMRKMTDGIAEARRNIAREMAYSPSVRDLAAIERNEQYIARMHAEMAADWTVIESRSHAESN